MKRVAASYQRAYAAVLICDLIAAVAINLLLDSPLQDSFAWYARLRGIALLFIPAVLCHGIFLSGTLFQSGGDAPSWASLPPCLAAAAGPSVILFAVPLGLLAFVPGYLGLTYLLYTRVRNIQPYSRSLRATLRWSLAALVLALVAALVHIALLAAGHIEATQGRLFFAVLVYLGLLVFCTAWVGIAFLGLRCWCGRPAPAPPEPS